MTMEYRAWMNAKRRCNDLDFDQYKDYGGRGIHMCIEWLDNFPAFFRHVGLKPNPSLVLDRLDNDGHYEPGNVRWVTRRESNRNRRPQPQGRRFTLSDSQIGYQAMAEILAIPKTTLIQKLEKVHEACRHSEIA